MKLIQVNDASKLISLQFENQEALSLIKLIHFVQKELDWEYSVRTGFDLSEADNVVHKIENIESAPNISILVLTFAEFMLIRQNIVEVLFAIPNVDFASMDWDENNLRSFFELIDIYGIKNFIWQNE